MGKGDNRRPRQVPLEQFESNYESVFGHKPLNVMPDAEREEFLRERDRLAQEEGKKE